MEIADPAGLSFIKFPVLTDVVGRYVFICREIEEEAANFLFDKVRRSYLASGGRLENLILRMGTTNAVGTFDLAIVNGVGYDRPTQPHVERVGGFGPIRNIRIECSTSLHSHVLPHIEAFVRSLESFQRLYEQKFIELHEKSNEILVRGIEPLLIAVCGNDEAKIIRSHCRLSITPAQSRKFRFHISRDQAEVLIQGFTKRKFDFEPDPVISMGGFLYCDEHDFFYEQFRSGSSGFLRARFANTEIDSINHSLQRVEKLISRSNEVSAIELADVNGYSLQISTAPKYEERIKAIVSRCASALTHQFETNVSNHEEASPGIGDAIRRMYVRHIARVERELQGSVVRSGIDHILEKLIDIFPKG